MPLPVIRDVQMQVLERAHLARSASTVLLQRMPTLHAALSNDELDQRANEIARNAIHCRVAGKAAFPVFALLAWRWGAWLDDTDADPALRHVLADNWLDGDEKVARWKARLGPDEGIA